MKEVCGKDLPREVRIKALNLFLHRYTGSFKPRWASFPMPNGEAYRPQYSTDDAWLDHTWFWIKADGQIAARRSCRSTEPFQH